MITYVVQESEMLVQEYMTSGRACVQMQDEKLDKKSAVRYVTVSSQSACCLRSQNLLSMPCSYWRAVRCQGKNTRTQRCRPQHNPATQPRSCLPPTDRLHPLSSHRPTRLEPILWPPAVYTEPAVQLLYSPNVCVAALKK